MANKVTGSVHTTWKSGSTTYNWWPNSKSSSYSSSGQQQKFYFEATKVSGKRQINVDWWITTESNDKAASPTYFLIYGNQKLTVNGSVKVNFTSTTVTQNKKTYKLAFVDAGSALDKKTTFHDINGDYRGIDRDIVCLGSKWEEGSFTLNADDNGNASFSVKGEFGWLGKQGLDFEKTFKIEGLVDPVVYDIDYKTNSSTTKSGTTISNMPSDQKKVHGENVVLSMSVPTAKNANGLITYAFKSWNTKSDGSGTNYGGGTTYSKNSDLDLYAQWEYTHVDETFNITYNGNLSAPYVIANLPQTATKNYGKSITIENCGNAANSRTGDVTHKFLRWNTAANGSGTNYSAGAAYSTNANLTLYAQWEYNHSDETYPITYDGRVSALKSGTSVTNVPSAQTKKYGVDINLSSTKPIAKNASGVEIYDFNYWEGTTSGGSKYNFRPGEKITGNTGLTLAAQWLYNHADETYTITYDTGSAGHIYGITVSSMPSASVKSYNATAYISTTTPEAKNSSGVLIYRFKSWNTKSDGTGTTYTGGTAYSTNSNLTLYAIWERTYNEIKYQVRYQDNSSSFVNNGTSVTNMPATSEKGYNSSVSISSVVPVAKNAAGVVTYVFKQWNTKADGTGTTYSANYNYTDNSDLTLYAIWTRTYNEVNYTISYDGNSSSLVSGNTVSNVPSSQEKNYHNNITLSKVKPTVKTSDGEVNYTFVRWFAKDSSPKTYYNPGDTYSTNKTITLLAEWAATTKKVSLKIPSGVTASDSLKKETTVTYYTKYTLPGATSVSKYGYSFIGWSSNVDKQVYSPGANVTIIKDTIFTPVFSANNYKISFVDKDGVKLSNSVSATFDAVLTGNFAFYSVQGYRVLGWSTSKLPIHIPGETAYPIVPNVAYGAANYTTGIYIGNGNYTETNPYYLSDNTTKRLHKIGTDITLYPVLEYATSMYVYTGSSWKLAMPYVYDGNTWKITLGYIYNNDTWKL